MREAHLSEEELARFQDGDASPAAANHLEWCAECKGRLRDLDTAIAAFAQYRNTVIGSDLPPIPKPWRSLAALQAESENAKLRRSYAWWRVPAWAAAVCAVVATVMILRHPAEPTVPAADQLLAGSAEAELPSNRMIAMRLHGRSLVRPAVLTSEADPEKDADLKHLAGLFAQAHYNWREPLSARSFQSWRSSLAVRRDQVSVIHPGSPQQAYRVRTETDSNVLRSASLTLRGAGLRPVSGAFQFHGESPLEMEEADAPPPSVAPGPVRNSPAAPQEIPASQADTLHVLAALNQIGADVGEPIVVSNDQQHHVLVTATGLSAERRHQVAAVLQGMPRVQLDLDANTSHLPSGIHPGPTERDSTGMPAPLRKHFEDKLGGPIALQELTDHVLEASGSAVSVAHALHVLIAQFPPPVEAALTAADRQLLRNLRLGHASTLQNLTSQLRTELKPLLPEATGPAAQIQKQDLLSTVTALDAALNRLLAGSYTQAAGEATLHLLAQQLDLLNRHLEEVRK